MLLTLSLPLSTLPAGVAFADSPPVQISSVNPGASSGSGVTGAVLNGYRYFSGQDSTNGTELWRTDGTPAGTTMVADINPGSGSSYPLFIVNVGNVLYFIAEDGVHGAQLWKSDGTAANTILLSTTASEVPLGRIANLNGEVFFKARDSVHGIELWKTDGTPAGTTLAADINPGSGRSDPDGFVNLNGALYFSAFDSVHGRELWRTDGTTAGTTMLTNINTPSSGTFVSSLRNVAGTLFFLNIHGADSMATIWKSDGTAAGTVQVPSPVNATVANIDVSPLGNTLLFTGAAPGHPYSLWKTDGTAAGTVQLNTVSPVGGASNLSDGTLTTIGNTAYFSGDDGVHGAQLWKTDGTVAGTVMVTTNFTNGSGPTLTATVNDTLFFTASTASGGSQLWKSDGTTQGTASILQRDATAFSSIGDKLLILSNYQLWEYDVPSPVPVAANLTLVPSSGTGTVGGTAGFTATATTAGNQPVSGVTIRYSVSGSVTASGSCVTDSTGSCSFGYTGPQLPGADLIDAYVDTNNNSQKDPSEPMANATMAWDLPSNASTSGSVHGHGKFTASNGDKFNVGFHAINNNGTVSGTCNIVDQTANTVYDCTDATVLVENVSTGQATIFGNVVINGQTTTYRIDVADNSATNQPDTFNFVTQTGYTAGGTLDSKAKITIQ